MTLRPGDSAAYGIVQAIVPRRGSWLGVRCRRMPPVAPGVLSSGRFVVRQVRPLGRGSFAAVSRESASARVTEARPGGCPAGRLRGP